MKGRHGITRIGAKMLIPYILLLALYVQFHGDYGPGGGFQAGVIFAAAFILYALIYGLASTTRVVSLRLAEKLVSVGVLIYAGVGVVTMLLGGNFLEYDAFNAGHDDAHAAVISHEVDIGAAHAAPADHGAEAAHGAHGDEDGHGGEDAHGGDDHGGEDGHGGGDGHGAEGAHGGGGHHASHAQHRGLLLIELGVGIAVFAAMLSIFYTFAGRGRS